MYHSNRREPKLKLYFSVSGIHVEGHKGQFESLLTLKKAIRDLELPVNKRQRTVQEVHSVNFIQSISVNQHSFELRWMKDWNTGSLHILVRPGSSNIWPCVLMLDVKLQHFETTFLVSSQKPPQKPQ